MEPCMGEFVTVVFVVACRYDYRHLGILAGKSFVAFPAHRWSPHASEMS